MSRLRSGGSFACEGVRGVSDERKIEMRAEEGSLTRAISPEKKHRSYQVGKGQDYGVSVRSRSCFDRPLAMVVARIS